MGTLKEEIKVEPTTKDETAVAAVNSDDTIKKFEEL